MKFLCDCAQLNEVISAVSRAVSAKSSLSVLEGILFRAEADSTVTLIGNDLEIGIEAKMQASVTEPGQIVLNAKMIGGIVRSLPQAQVSIEVGDNRVALIKSGNAKFEIAGIAPDEFPDLPQVSSDYSAEIPAAVWKDMISKTIFAVANTDNNPILTGSLLKIEPGSLTMVALDGYRMAIRKVELEHSFAEKDIIIPAKTLGELPRILGDSEGAVRICVTDRHAMFLFGDYRMVTRLIEGNFINYQSVIPPDFDISFTCPVQELLNSVQRASLLILNDVVKNPIKLIIGDGGINLSCKTPAGSVDDTIPAEVGDAALEIGFYNRYLLEAFRVIDDEAVRLQFKSATGPMVILPEEGDGFLYLILPLRLRAE